MFVAVALVGIGLAVWIPSRPSPDAQGKFHVSEAASALYILSRSVEDFYAQNGRVPDVRDLAISPVSGESVEKLTGSNPYYAILKTTGVYAPVAGKTLGWTFDPVAGQWDMCTLGTIDIRFKSENCRKSGLDE